MVLLTKEDFCYYMNRLRLADDIDKKINNLFANNDSAGCSDLSYLAYDVCELLVRLIGGNDGDADLIYDFCTIGNFTKNKDRFSIDGAKIGNAEELYDCIVTNDVDRGD